MNPAMPRKCPHKRGHWGKITWTKEALVILEAETRRWSHKSRKAESHWKLDLEQRGFSPGTLISGFWPLELGENKFLER